MTKAITILFGIQITLWGIFDGGSLRAQTVEDFAKKGKILIGGDSFFSASDISSSGRSESVLYLNLRGGYFVSDRVVLGADAYFTTEKQVIQMAASAGPFIRFYVTDSFVMLFVQGGISVQEWKILYDNISYPDPYLPSPPYGVKRVSFAPHAAAGINIPFSQYVAFESKLRYYGTHVNAPVSFSVRALELWFGLNLAFGGKK